MPRKYVCNPKTDRVIEVGGATYKEVSKNAADRRKLERSPKNTSKKKLTPCKSPRRRRKSPKGGKRRGRPRGPVKCGSPKGWSAIKPGGHERTVMLDKCGKKCFLGRDKTFPICAAGSCRRNQKGVSAACIRARQMSSPRSKKVKGRSKAYYNAIAKRALALRNTSRRGISPRRYHLPRVNTNNISPWRMIHNETSPNSYTYYYSNANTHKLLGPLMAGQLNYTLEQIESYKRSIDKTEEENIDKWESGHYGNNSSGRSTSHSGSWYT